jgi:hypothetical protein
VAPCDRPIAVPEGPMEKSGVGIALTITDNAVECDRVPLTPETITV